MEVRDGRIQAKVQPPAAAAGPGPRYREDPAGGWRVRPPVDDTAVGDAVLAARALVRLDEQAWETRRRLAAAEAQLEALRADLAAACERRDAAVGRLNVVVAIHSEAWRTTSTCVDGCCVDGEPTGVCRTCGEPDPCTTTRAAKGDVDGG